MKKSWILCAALPVFLPLQSTAADAGPAMGDAGIHASAVDAGGPPNVGESCDAETFVATCEGTTWTRCSDNIVEQLDCNGDDYWTDPSFGPAWTCGVRGCLSDTAGFCEERAAEARCVPQKDGGYCRGYLGIVDPNQDSLYVCEEGGSCIVGAEDNGSGLRLRERCRLSLGSCEVGDSTKSCQGDVATFCRELVSGGTSFTVPDVMGYDCSVQGWTCADSSTGASTCVTGGDGKTCMTGDDFLVGCGAGGAIAENSACNIVETLGIPVGSDASNGTCVSSSDISSCDPNSFNPRCMGDFLALDCMPFGQAKGLDCASTGLEGSCVLDGPQVGGTVFCAVGAGKPCNGSTVQCAEGASCSLSGTCVSDDDDEIQDDDSENQDEAEPDEAAPDQDPTDSEGCGCNQHTRSTTHPWGLLLLGFVTMIARRKPE